MTPEECSQMKDFRINVLGEFSIPVLTILLCFIFLGGLLPAQLESVPVKTLPFSDGEKIIFSVQKMGLKVGEAVLIFQGSTKLGGKEASLIIFTAKSLNFFDEEKIFVDPQTFYPLLVKRDLNIWGKKEKITEEYFPPKSLVKITKEAGGKTSEQTIGKKGQIDNIYSFIYRYRTQGQFRMGDTLALHLPTKEVILILKKKTNIKAASRQFEAYYMTSDPAQYEVWFDNSDQKIPLKINGAVGLGDTAMVMVSYQKTDLQKEHHALTR